MTKFLQIINLSFLNFLLKRKSFPFSRIHFLFLLLFTCGHSAFSQTYNMNNSTQTTCAGTFYDSGGGGRYGSNENFTETFCTGVAGQCIQFVFSSFSMYTGDTLFVYNGPSTV